MFSSTIIYDKPSQKFPNNCLPGRLNTNRGNLSSSGKSKHNSQKAETFDTISLFSLWINIPLTPKCFDVAIAIICNNVKEYVNYTSVVNVMPSEILKTMGIIMNK